MNYVDETNPGEMMDKAIKSMLADLDPYTNYFNEADVVKFKINNTGEYTGIGAMITRKEGKIIIKEPYKNYPADKAGLKAGRSTAVTEPSYSDLVTLAANPLNRRGMIACGEV
jgi:carboxyl-terminal processing protease